MAAAEHLKKLEALRIENKRLNEKLYELSESIAKLKKAQGVPIVRRSGHIESSGLH
jgi:hypothetical protein